jgi:hypothetical protein
MEQLCRVINFVSSWEPGRHWGPLKPAYTRDRIPCMGEQSIIMLLTPEDKIKGRRETLVSRTGFDSDPAAYRDGQH